MEIWASQFFILKFNFLFFTTNFHFKPQTFAFHHKIHLKARPSVSPSPETTNQIAKRFLFTSSLFPRILSRSPLLSPNHTLSKTSEKSTCTDDSLRRSRYLYVYVYVPANVYFNVLIYICMNVLMCISSNIQCAFLRKCPFSSCATVFLARGSRTTTFLTCDSSLVRAHLRLRSCASVFLLRFSWAFASTFTKRKLWRAVLAHKILPSQQLRSCAPANIEGGDCTKQFVHKLKFT